MTDQPSELHDSDPHHSHRHSHHGEEEGEYTDSDRGGSTDPELPAGTYVDKDEMVANLGRPAGEFTDHDGQKTNPDPTPGTYTDTDS